jgi:hypothetical protein
MPVAQRRNSDACFEANAVSNRNYSIQVMDQNWSSDLTGTLELNLQNFLAGWITIKLSFFVNIRQMQIHSLA